jgi:hypothetical protein
LIVHLRVLAGKDTGAVRVVRRFPCLVGRSPKAHLRLEEAGVWDRHLRLQVNAREGIVAEVLPGALATINGKLFDRNVLRNGDLIEVGAARLQFWLGPTRQRTFLTREYLTWLVLAGVCAAQIALIYLLAL